MSVMMYEITGNSTFCHMTCSSWQKNQISALLSLYEGNPHIIGGKNCVTWETSPCHDVIMIYLFTGYIDKGFQIWLQPRDQLCKAASFPVTENWIFINIHLAVGTRCVEPPVGSQCRWNDSDRHAPRPGCYIYLRSVSTNERNLLSSIENLIDLDRWWSKLSC